MSIIQLSKEERERFAMWLETQVSQNVALVEQTKKLSGPTVAALREVMQQRNAAYILVAHELRSVQEDSVGE